MKTNVTFKSHGIAIKGELYIPDEFCGGALPGIVVFHPTGGVKE